MTPDDHIVRLGSEETNGLLFAVTYEGSNIYFSFAHNFCGACGMMRWLKFDMLPWPENKADMFPCTIKACDGFVIIHVLYCSRKHGLEIRRCGK